MTLKSEIIVANYWSAGFVMLWASYYCQQIMVVLVRCAGFNELSYHTRKLDGRKSWQISLVIGTSLHLFVHMIHSENIIGDVYQFSAFHQPLACQSCWSDDSSTFSSIKLSCCNISCELSVVYGTAQFKLD